MLGIDSYVADEVVHYELQVPTRIKNERFSALVHILSASFLPWESASLK